MRDEVKVYYKNGKRIIRVRTDHLFTIFCFAIAIVTLSSAVIISEYIFENYSVYDADYWILTFLTAMIIVAALLLLFSGVMGMHLAILSSTTEDGCQKTDGNEGDNDDETDS